MMHCIGRPARAGWGRSEQGCIISSDAPLPRGIGIHATPATLVRVCLALADFLRHQLASSQHSLPKIFYRGYCEEKQLMRSEDTGSMPIILCVCAEVCLRVP